MSKVFDFFDTLFIVLGKKWSQVCRERERERERERDGESERMSVLKRAYRSSTHTQTNIIKYNGQLSFLHVYHHLTIFMFYWINCNIGYDGDM